MKSQVTSGDWDVYPIECPVCGCGALLIGQTEERGDYDEDGSPSLSLEFVGESFECEECGLKLEDYDELLIAGIEPDVDRSDEVDSWVGQNDYDMY